jgi:formate-dependent nitrite reductase membrane component NrfD
MEDSSTEIFQLLASQAVKTRKPEKATQPNLFYIDADDVSLIPSATEKSNVSLWGSQEHGVGHYAKEAEKLAFSSGDIIAEAIKLNRGFDTEAGKVVAPTSVEVLMNKAKRVYDSPDKGILWGWEVSAYVWTKAISAGAFLVPFLAWVFGLAPVNSEVMLYSSITGIIFLGLTGIFLVMDLDRPDRFLYVLLRPHWGSWLVKGGYAISIYGGLLTLLAATFYFGWEGLMTPLMYITFILACTVAIYTAFLFAQAKGRDFWQSPTLSIHMLVHSFMAGAAMMMILGLYIDLDSKWIPFLEYTLIGGIAINLFTMLIELTTTHPTKDAKTTVEMIVHGRYKLRFWGVVLGLGNIIPIAILLLGSTSGMTSIVAAILVLIGIYMTEHIWVEAPQRIALS